MSVAVSTRIVLNKTLLEKHFYRYGVLAFLVLFTGMLLDQYPSVCVCVCVDVCIYISIHLDLDLPV